jgi:hypothetical protein
VTWIRPPAIVRHLQAREAGGARSEADTHERASPFRCGPNSVRDQVREHLLDLASRAGHVRRSSSLHLDLRPPEQGRRDPAHGPLQHLVEDDAVPPDARSPEQGEVLHDGGHPLLARGGVVERVQHLVEAPGGRLPVERFARPALIANAGHLLGGEPVGGDRAAERVVHLVRHARHERSDRREPGCDRELLPQGARPGDVQDAGDEAERAAVGTAQEGRGHLGPDDAAVRPDVPFRQRAAGDTVGDCLHVPAALLDVLGVRDVADGLSELAGKSEKG